MVNKKKQQILDNVIDSWIQLCEVIKPSTAEDNGELLNFQQFTEKI